MPTVPVASRLTHATAADAPAITELVNLAFAPEISFRNGTRTNVETVRAELEKGMFFLLRHAAESIACVYIEPRGEAGYIGMLVVHPTHQNRGLGRMLMAHAEEELRRRGCRRAELVIVNIQTRLEALYSKLGYRVVGTAPYPPEIKTRLPVHFLRMEKELA